MDCVDRYLEEPARTTSLSKQNCALNSGQGRSVCHNQSESGTNNGEEVLREFMMWQWTEMSLTCHDKPASFFLVAIKFFRYKFLERDAPSRGRINVQRISASAAFHSHPSPPVHLPSKFSNKHHTSLFSKIPLQFTIIHDLPIRFLMFFMTTPIFLCSLIFFFV